MGISSSTLTVKPTQLRGVLARSLKGREPILITGMPGIGKTDVVTQACFDNDADMVTFHPVTSDPTDFKGMPCITPDGVLWVPDSYLSKLIRAERLTCAFFDDLGQATPATQAAAMQLPLARRINGHRVSDNVVFFAATNRKQDRAGVSGIIEPLKSRFTILELQCDVGDWQAWAAQNRIAPEVLAYISFRNEHLCAFEPTTDMTNSPSPRGWHRVARHMALDHPQDVMAQVVAGCVGAEAGASFVAFLRIYRSMVSPDMVLKNPDKAPIPDEPSALYALVTALSYRVMPETIKPYTRYLARLIEGGSSEFAMCSVKLMTARDKSLQTGTDYINAMAGPLGQLMMGGAT